MTEDEFAQNVANFLEPKLEGVNIKTKLSLIYSLTIDEKGAIQPKLRGLATRGQDAFEQDIVIYNRVFESAVPLVPRVVIETKLGRVTTHDALVYSTKAYRLKVVYPYLRYVLLLGDMKQVPNRVLKHGIDFDAVVCIPAEADNNEWEHLLNVISEEVKTSKTLMQILKGEPPISCWRRTIKWECI